uniref:Reverse transcriptase n=1 Tax=Cannabis sativa TaxID=3483 RepID=A0A803PKA3_CANSA
MRRRCKELLGIEGASGNINYLGLPLLRTRQKDAAFHFILENLMSKLQGWKMKILSKAGRATLIKSDSLALPPTGIVAYVLRPETNCADPNLGVAWVSGKLRR